MSAPRPPAIVIDFAATVAARRRLRHVSTMAPEIPAHAIRVGTAVKLPDDSLGIVQQIGVDDAGQVVGYTIQRLPGPRLAINAQQVGGLKR